MIRDAIARLINGEDLDRAQAEATMDDIMNGDATESQIAGLLVALRLKGETVDEIVGLVSSMRSHARTLTAPDGAVDTCGTGGDGAGTFNISTAAAIVVRGAGAPVAKHGNRSSSSLCGSADVLEALGVPMSLTADQVQACLDATGICFMLAPTFHPAMRHAGVPRKDLGIRTVFNILGPLANPAMVRRQSLGVASAQMAPLMASVLKELGHERALVFCGSDGLDELSVAAPSRVWELRDGEIREYDIDGASLGLAVAQPGDLKGGDAAANAVILNAILDGETGSRRDVVLLNAAAALVAAGAADDLPQGIEKARASIDSGAARQALADLRDTAQSLASAP
ncbi:MAG TPA: anthranilate phosphoribosyltransferase [Candidatus Dormibacteraeota bacterium]|nr:anthranilate phosphoribosyltransferase [Candidatus Dormibacteraeota bacterium]